MRLTKLATAGALALSTAGIATSAQAEDLTLCWAAWDPANALVELSKEFEAASGHTMSFEFIPWPNFADRMLNELNSGGQLCDLLIGDSQWIGGANGWFYRKDWFERDDIKAAFMDATGRELAEPKTQKELLEEHARLL